MKRITREKVKVDRVASPWLVKKFIDMNAEFYFVPSEQVAGEGERLNAISGFARKVKNMSIS